MNIITKLSAVVFVLMAMLSSCEEKEWVENEVSLVPVYSVTELTKTSTDKLLSDPEKLNVYQTQAMHIETKGELVLSKEIMNYVDNSIANDTINFSYTIEEEYLSNNDTIDNAIYQYNANVLDSIGTLTISKVVVMEGVDNDTVVVAAYSGKMFSTEVYY